ncbi:MAG TPA: translation initiation factor IF-2 [Tissierellaceae bacterium]|nr:translation initiation factor IF-2 [Tissierellaceae bacterium]
MTKIRIYELAKKLDMSSKNLIKEIENLDLDMGIKSHMSSVEDEEAQLIKELLLGTNGDDKMSDKNTELEQDSSREVKDEEIINIEKDETIIVRDLAKKMDKSPSELITKLMSLGIMVNQNQSIDSDTAIILGEEFDLNIKVNKKADKEEEKIVKYNLDFKDKPEDLKPRSAVVTVMGHVDHGKTSLLDAIRETQVTIGEAGGITQHIGAYEVNVNDEKLVFLDTPGHEAFTSMRARGAQVTDIAILVVAADDGVMPQTIEAINHAKAAQVPIIVAINKIDKPEANLDRIYQELTENNLLPETWGGDIITVPVSAKQRTGIDDLLEMLLLVAEMQELKANPNRTVVGTIIEAELDKGKGPIATVLVQKGTMKVGDMVVSGTASGRIRAMIDDNGNRVNSAGPSTPVVILGLSEVPNAGELFYSVKDERVARKFAESKKQEIREAQLKSTTKVSLDDLFEKIQEGEIQDLNIIIKADGRGSIEALSQSLQKLDHEEVRINIIHGGVGGIAKSDVMLASASNAIIIGFNVRPNLNTIEAAERENVDIRTYSVIYEAIEDIQAAVKGMLAPTIVEEVQGRAEVRDTFRLPNNTTVAGIYVLDGKITRQSYVRLLRDDIVIFEGKVGSLRRFKDDVKEVTTGYEAGLGLEDYNDVKENDIFEAYILKEVER